MNPLFIRLDDESPFTSPMLVDQPLGEPAALARTAVHHPFVDGNGVIGIWECTPGCFYRQVEWVEYSYIVSGEGRFTSDEGQAVELRANDALYFATAARGTWDIRQTVCKIYLALD